MSADDVDAAARHMNKLQGSGGLSVVLVDKPTETVAARDLARLWAQWFEMRTAFWRLQVETTVRALEVVVLDVCGEQMVKVPGT